MSSRQDIHPHELLSPYLDGELDRDARSAIDEHLAGCSTCRALLQDFRSMATASAQEAPPPVPADLRARVRLALEPRKSRGGAVLGRGLWSYRLGIGAAAGLVLVIGLWVLQQGPLPPERAPVPVSMNSDIPKDSGRADARAGAKPRSTAPPQTGELTDQLRSLGYIGRESGKENEPALPPALQRRMAEGSQRLEEAPARPSAPPAALESRPAPPAHEARDVAPPPTKRAVPAVPPGAGTPGTGVVREDAASDERGFVRMQVEGKKAGVPAYGVEAPPGRSLLVTFPAYTVRVSEDGTIALSAAEYSCSARLDGPSVDPDITALLTLATAAEKEAPRARGPAPSGAPAVRVMEPPATAGKTAGAGGGVDLPAGQAREIERRLKALLRDRYLALLEGRCGPAPRVVRAP